MAELEPLPERPAHSDPAASPVPTTPITRPPGGPAEPGVAGGPPSARSGRAALRWIVALVVLALVVGTVSVAAAFLAATGTSSVVEGWMPKGTLAYVELRADLPGNQRTQVGTILQAFPGFRDQAQADAIVDEALTELFDRANVSWTSDIKPWLGGEVGIAITGGLFDTATKGLASLGTVPQTTPPTVAVDDGAVVLVSVKDGTAASAWLRGWLARTTSASPTTSQVGGGDLLTLKVASVTVSWAVRGQVLIFGLDSSVKAALETAGKSDLAASANFQAAKKVAPGAYLAFGYLDMQAYISKTLAMQAAASRSLGSLGMSSTSGMLSSACIDQLTALMPGWVGGSMEAVDGALRFDVIEPVPSGTPTNAAGNGASAAIAHLPGSTVAEYGIRDFGPLAVAGWTKAEQMLACDPSMKSALGQVDSALAFLGGLDGIVGWAGDTSIALTRDGTAWGGGLVAATADESKATAMVGRIKGLLALAGQSSGLTVKDEPLGTGTMTTLSTDASRSSSRATVAMTAQHGVFVLGTVDFVKAVVGTGSGSSLADVAAYKDAIQRAGGPGVDELYVDITSIRGGIEVMTPSGSAMDAYKTGVQPYLSPFDKVAMVDTAVAGSTRSGHLVVVFTK